MIKKVVFFNFYHNGDLHVCRNLVKEISRLCVEKGIICEYYFEAPAGLMDDIENVSFTSEKYDLAYNKPSYVRDDILFFNTWYAGNPAVYMEYKCSFDTLFRSFSENCKLLEIDLSKLDILELFPSINYNKFYICKAERWLEEHNRKRVFISNGEPISAQSVNYPMCHVINGLSGIHPNIDFLISNEENGILLRDNVFMTRDIIQKQGADLNENSYLASACPIIAGRYSGTYTFAMTKENYFDNPKTFVAIVYSHMNPIWTYQFTPAPKAKIVSCNNFDDNAIFGAINKEILEIM
jgi:hypothetical protein